MRAATKSTLITLARRARP